MELPIPGEFEILGLISAHGAQADVYRARQSSLDNRLVAIKLYREPLRDEAGRARFLREVRSMVELGGHANVVRLERADLADGRPYLVMELCERSLGDQLAADGPLSSEQVASIAIKACSALSAAHARGILHRDLKPTNLLWTSFGELVVGDFGIAMLATADTDVTATMLRGTHGFLAPELLNGSQPSVQSDIYALGVTLFALLYNRIPTPGERIDDGAVGSGLAAAITAALAKEPDDRQRSAEDFARTVSADHAAGPLKPTLIDPDVTRDAPHRTAGWLDDVDGDREPELTPAVTVKQPPSQLQPVGWWATGIAALCGVLLGAIYWTPFLALVLVGAVIWAVGYRLTTAKDQRLVTAGWIGLMIGGAYLAGNMVNFVFASHRPGGVFLSLLGFLAAAVAYLAKAWWQIDTDEAERASGRLAGQHALVDRAESVFEHSGPAPLWLKELLELRSVRLYRLAGPCFEYAAASGTHVCLFRTVHWSTGRYQAIRERPYIWKDGREWRPGRPDVAPALDELVSIRGQLTGATVRAFIVVLADRSAGAIEIVEAAADFTLVTPLTATDVAGRHLIGDPHRIDIPITEQLLRLSRRD